MQRYESQIYIPVPDYWFAKESLTVLAPDGQANVIASSEPLDESIDTEQYAQVQGDLLRAEFPGYREFSFKPTMTFGRRGMMRRFEWRPPDGVPVIQMQMYYAANSRGYTATATTPATNYDRFEGAFHQILGGLDLK